MFFFIISNSIHNSKEESSSHQALLCQWADLYEIVRKSKGKLKADERHKDQDIRNQITIFNFSPCLNLGYPNGTNVHRLYYNYCTIYVKLLFIELILWL